MRLYHNTMSLNVFRNYSKSLVVQSKSLDKISTGYKINGAIDNPVKIAQSENMRMQIRGMQMAQKNVQDGVSLLQTAEGSMDSMRNYLNRIRELAVQGGNGSYSGEEKDAINAEIKSLISGFDNAYDIADTNGVKLLNDTNSDNSGSTSINVSSGSMNGEKISITTYDLSSTKLGLTNIDVKNNDASTNLVAIDKAIDTVLTVSGKYGALCNRLESTLNILDENALTTQKAESGIRDADIAEEMIEFSRGSLLKDAGIAMMAQTNNFPNDILRILERVK